MIAETTTTQHCTALRRDGSPCRARAQTGKPYCPMHDPQREKQMQAARVAGGKARNRIRPAPPAKLRTTADQLTMIEEAIDRVRRGDESPNVAKVVLLAISAARPLVELGELEERLRRLEELNGKA